MKTLFLWAVLLTAVSQAAEVKLSVLEKKTQGVSFYIFDVESSRLKPLAAAGGGAVKQTTTYSIQNGRLLAGGKKVTSATELLYQCRVDGVDLVIVRDEYNSFSNPLRVLAAFSGHPIQVSKIVILKVLDGKLRGQTEIARKPASYHWTAAVLE